MTNQKLKIERTDELCLDLLDKIHRNNLQFLGLIDLSTEEAIRKIKGLKSSTFLSLRNSVEFHSRSKHTHKPSLKIAELPLTEKDVTPVVKTEDPNKKLYEKILDPNADVDSIDSKYLILRCSYLAELRELEATPGCSACKKGKLKRKYLDQLKRL